MKEEDVITDGSMQQYCINHPHRKNPGGICAFCLQEKLGKLVSSSFPLPMTPSSSSLSSPPSSSPPSFRSQTLPPSSSSSLSSLSIPPTFTKHDPHTRSRLPFLLPNKNKKKKPSSINMNMNTNTNTNPSSFSSANVTSDVVFKRSKSIASATPRRAKFLSDDGVENGDFKTRKRNRFWSFLHLSSSSKQPSSSYSKKTEEKSCSVDSNSSPRISAVKPKFCSSVGRNNCEMVVEEEEEVEEAASGSSSGSGSGCFEQEQRKVSRSRSVGCGSRSFSGDFFEKFSTGFGDCTLRRVESQREGKANKVIPSCSSSSSAATGNRNIQHCMKDRVKCGGIFGGFMMMNSSSSSYWVSNGEDGRSRSSWGWALASPMRAFSSKSSSKDNKSTSEKNNTPNLSAVPSLLIARG
ncbi:cell wall protein RBR3 [Vicia villosa]|uniref:cell wall protein RBR3 n=1 Tax=Vicia villosa TaxID=3911 RepID=UPI00273CA641|nr:cell wall protein RBR3 [Vicia villosa]